MKSSIITFLSAVFLLCSASWLNGQERYRIDNIVRALKAKDCMTAVELLPEVKDINFRDAYGGTLLMHASLNGCNELVKALLERGAKTDLRSNDGFTALHMASRNGYPEIVKVLLAKGGSERCAKA